MNQSSIRRKYVFTKTTLTQFRCLDMSPLQLSSHWSLSLEQVAKDKPRGLYIEAKFEEHCRKEEHHPGTRRWYYSVSDHPEINSKFQETG